MLWSRKNTLCVKTLAWCLALGWYLVNIALLSSSFCEMQRQSSGPGDMHIGHACGGNQDISHYTQVEEVMHRADKTGGQFYKRELNRAYLLHNKRLGFTTHKQCDSFSLPVNPSSEEHIWMPVWWKASTWMARKQEHTGNQISWGEDNRYECWVLGLLHSVIFWGTKIFPTLMSTNSSLIGKEILS